MNIQRIKETCIYIADIERTKAFYNGQLEMPVISQVDGRHIFFRAGESVLLCFIAAATEQITDLPPHGAFGSIHFAFEIQSADYDKMVDFISNQKIEILHHQQWPNGRRSCYFRDPDQHLVELVEEGLWEEK